MKCIICGKEIKESKYTNDILCSHKCFVKNFWNKIISEKDKHVIINGVCYTIGEPIPSYHSQFAGFGGRVFYIKYFDGRIVRTNNLWFNGDIPQEYREVLKDEAKFYYPQIKNKEGVDN